MGMVFDNRAVAFVGFNNQNIAISLIYIAENTLFFLQRQNRCSRNNGRA